MNNDQNTFFKGEQVKPLLSTENLNADDLKRYLLFTFASLKVAGQKAGFSDDVRVLQILTGYKIPKNPIIIKRIAEAWRIDSIVLTQLFERLKTNNFEEAKEDEKNKISS